VAEHARAKLESKQADVIVATSDGRGCGFDHETNIITAVFARWQRKRFLECKNRRRSPDSDRILELRRAGREVPATQRAQLTPRWIPASRKTSARKIGSLVSLYDDLILGNSILPENNGKTFRQTATIAAHRRACYFSY